MFCAIYDRCFVRIFGCFCCCAKNKTNYGVNTKEAEGCRERERCCLYAYCKVLLLKFVYRCLVGVKLSGQKPKPKLRMTWRFSFDLLANGCRLCGVDCSGWLHLPSLFHPKVINVKQTTRSQQASHYRGVWVLTYIYTSRV